MVLFDQILLSVDVKSLFRGDTGFCAVLVFCKFVGARCLQHTDGHDDTVHARIASSNVVMTSHDPDHPSGFFDPIHVQETAVVATFLSGGTSPRPRVRLLRPRGCVLRLLIQV